MSNNHSSLPIDPNLQLSFPIQSQFSSISDITIPSDIGEEDSTSSTGAQKRGTVSIHDTAKPKKRKYTTRLIYLDNQRSKAEEITDAVLEGLLWHYMRWLYVEDSQQLAIDSYPELRGNLAALASAVSIISDRSKNWKHNTLDAMEVSLYKSFLYSK